MCVMVRLCGGRGIVRSRHNWRWNSVAAKRLNCVRIGNPKVQFDSGPLSGHTVDDAASTDRSEALFEVWQTVAGNQPVPISATARCRQALAVVVDAQRERIGGA